MVSKGSRNRSASKLFYESDYWKNKEKKSVANSAKEKNMQDINKAISRVQHQIETIDAQLENFVESQLDKLDIEALLIGRDELTDELDILETERFFIENAGIKGEE